MIEKYPISKDKKYYRAFTDLIEVNGRLICSFAEMNNQTKNIIFVFVNQTIEVIRGLKEEFYKINLMIMVDGIVQELAR